MGSGDSEGSEDSEGVAGDEGKEEKDGASSDPERDEGVVSYQIFQSFDDVLGQSLSRDLKCIRLATIRESCYWEILSTFWPGHFVCTQKSATTHGKGEHYCNTACKFFPSNFLIIIAVTRRESRLKVGGAAKPGFLDRWSQLGRNRHNLPRIGDEAASENRLAAAKI